MNGSTPTSEATESQLKRKMEDGDLSDDDLPLAVRQKPVGSEAGGSDAKKIKLERKEPVKSLNNGAQSLQKPTIKQEKLSPVKNHLHASVSLKKKPIPQFTGNDSDDDVPLAVRAKLKTEATDVHKVKVKKSKDGTPVKQAKKSGDKKAEVKKEVKKEGKKASKPAKTPALDSDSDDDAPLSSRVKTPSSKKPSKDKVSSGKKKKADSSGSLGAKRKKNADSDSEDDYKPLAKTIKKSGDKAVKKEGKSSDAKRKVKKEPSDKKPAKEPKSEKKKEEEKDVWKWWEEEKLPDGVKWRTLEHKGPYFPPLYEPLADDIKFYYDGKAMKLSLATEEVATFYAKMLDHEYTQKDIFNKNFFEDWRKEMTKEEREIIKDLKKCNFKEMHAYFVQKNEDRKNMSKEEKQVLKKANEEILQEYGFCVMDGHKQRVGNFKIEPPGLFRGRGDHPKQGKLKKRIMPESITINIGKGTKVPEPPEGHKWMKVIHDTKVTWLACWVENIQGSYKYVMLNPTSRLKGEKDWQKYETARKLKDCVERIRRDYQEDWKCKEMRIRQRGVALYFIDKLALRAGHEKDDDTADTVGCCSLRVEHIKLHEEWEDKENVVEFDFLGKDSVRYWNFVPVEKRVFKNLKLFMAGKSEGDDLFDRLTTTSLNKYLTELMEGLTAKVFRTFNASLTLQDQLGKLTDPEDNVNAKVLSYNRANRAVAILCNHQRSVPKTFEKTMSNLQTKISDKKKTVKEAKKELKELKQKCKDNKRDDKAAAQAEKKKNQVKRLEEQLFKLEVTATDKEENKEIALGTSKLNYLDPRITVAWCKKHEVPVEKTYNKTQREKFAWALDMADKDFVF